MSEEKTVEQRLAILEARVDHEDDEINKLYLFVLPELDKEISVIRHDGYSMADKTRANVKEAQDAVAEVRSTIRAALADTIADLVSKSSSSIVAEALSEALRSIILVTRPASRAEANNPNTLVVRQASAAEIREQ
jgi:hypothetical protein